MYDKFITDREVRGGTSSPVFYKHTRRYEIQFPEKNATWRLQGKCEKFASSPSKHDILTMANVPAQIIPMSTCQHQPGHRHRLLRYLPLTIVILLRVVKNNILF